MPSNLTSPSGWGAMVSSGFTAMPGASASTRNIDSPRCSAASPLRASTVYMPAIPAFEMNVFTPRRCQSAPSGVARVRTPARSEPASGSVTANAASRPPPAIAGSQRFFWTSVPARLTTWEPSPCIAKAVSASEEK